MPPEFDRPFDSAAGVLGRSARIFAARLPFLAAVTLAVFVPGKLLLQLACAAFDIAPEGLASYLLMDASTLVLSAWTVPAAIYGLLHDAPFAESLANGRRLWGRMLWNKFKVEMTVTLYSLLLFVPGLIAMARLEVTYAIVAVEGGREPQALARSAELTEGRRWRVFLVVAPLGIVDLVGSFYLLGAIPGAAHSRLLLALLDSVWAIFSMWATVAGLLIYIGRVGRPATVANPPRKSQRQRR